MLAAALALFAAAATLTDTPAALSEAFAVMGAVLLGSWVAMLAAGIGGNTVTGTPPTEPRESEAADE